jgi:hypothetical protein
MRERKFSMSFAQITSGPATATGQNTNKGALIFDKTSNIVESVGDAGLAAANQTALYILTAQTALSNVTTAQNLFNQTLNRSVLNKLNRTLQIAGTLLYTTPGTTTPTLTIALVLGGVTLCAITVSALNTVASTNMPVQFYFEIMTASTGNAGTIEAHGFVNANISANTPGASVTTFNDTNIAVSAPVNLMTALPLQVQVSASSAITSIQLRQFSVEVVF